MSFESLFHKYRATYYNFPQSLKTFLGSMYGNIPLHIRFGKNYTIHKKNILEFENGN